MLTEHFKYYTGQVEQKLPHKWENTLCVLSTFKYWFVKMSMFSIANSKNLWAKMKKKCIFSW